MMLHDKTILLIISGGIAAYKSLDLIRQLRKAGAQVRCIVSKGGAQFVTPMSVAALSEHEVYTDLFSLKDESEMGHIRLSREADLILVAPASANMIAKMAHGLADDLASTCILASDKPVMIVPAMNPMMWDHQATQDNIETLSDRGVGQIGPASGEMACGETGMGRMAEPEDILSAVYDFFFERPLKGKHAIVTSGPTYEAIDPVRFIGNRSSGKQGHAIACALIKAGAGVTYISGPTALSCPPGANSISVEAASEMLEAVENALPADIFIGAAAVCDWAVDNVSTQKLKKREGQSAPALTFTENPDILKTVSSHENRPELVCGFAAETQDMDNNAKAKLLRKKCDWLVGNNVCSAQNIFGSDENEVCLFKYTDIGDQDITSQTLIRMKKEGAADFLVNEIISVFENKKDQNNEPSHTTRAAE